MLHNIFFLMVRSLLAPLQNPKLKEHPATSYTVCAQLLSLFGGNFFHLQAEDMLCNGIKGTT
jgi:hypothetical protein